MLAPTVVVLVAWAVSWDTTSRTGADATTAARTAVHIWLTALHVPLAVPGGRFTLVPLGLTLLQVALLAGAGGWSVRAETAAAPALFLGCAHGDRARHGAGRRLRGAGGGGGSAGRHRRRGHGRTPAGRSGTASCSPSHAAVWRGQGGRPARRGSGPAAAAGPGGSGGAAGAVAVLVAAARCWPLGSLLVHHDRVGELTEALAPGPLGAIALYLLCLVLIPNGALWGAAYAAGPGFAVGTGTAVAPTGVQLGGVPALPLLAALPNARRRRCWPGRRSWCPWWPAWSRGCWWCARTGPRA